jgi:hypothetical protein
LGNVGEKPSASKVAARTISPCRRRIVAPRARDAIERPDVSVGADEHDHAAGVRRPDRVGRMRISPAAASPDVESNPNRKR